MMMSNLSGITMITDPWESIAKSEHPGLDNVRAADPGHPLIFRRGKDYQGRYLFFLEGSDFDINVSDLPILSGIDIDLNDGVPARIVLTLLEQDQNEIFLSLCINLVEATRHLSKGHSKEGARIVVDRLKRWQRLLNKRSASALSKSEVMGLVGELLFLQDVLLKEMPISDAVNAWTGPLGNEQDFALRRCALEVKTQLISSDKELRISSEHQLDGRPVPILIWHLLLGADSSAKSNRLTLNNLVATLRGIAFHGSTRAVDMLNTALMEVGYWPRSEYDDYSWQVVGSKFFEVREGFPSITPADLTSGIHGVSYFIDMEACLGFAISDEEAKEKLFSENY
jgi:hypothetical protein